MQAMWKTVLSLGHKDALEEGMATQRSLEGYSPWGHRESDTAEKTEHKWTYSWNRNKSAT